MEEMIPVDDPIFGKVKPQLDTPETVERKMAQVERILDAAHDKLFGATSTPEPTRFFNDDAEHTNALGLESTREHTRIAKVWQEKCSLMEDVIERERLLSVRKWDVREYPLADLKIEVETLETLDVSDLTSARKKEVPIKSEIRLSEGKYAGMPLNPRGLETLASFVDVPESYISKLVDYGMNDLAAENVNRMVQRRLDSPGRGGALTCTARFIDDHDKGTGSNLRCVASANYGILNNLDALEILRDAIGDGKILASHMFNDTDRIYGNFFPEDRMITQRGDSDYGVGIAFRNSECLQSAFAIQPFLFRAVCLNGMIWGRRDGVEMLLTQRHIGKLDLVKIREQARIGIQAAMGKSEALLAMLNMCHDAEIALPNAAVAHLCRAHELTKEQGRAWSGAFMVEPEPTAWGVINALTRAAQAPMFAGEKRSQMEELAGDLLCPSLTAGRDAVLGRWSSVDLAARTLYAERPEVVEQYALVFA